MGLIRYHEKMSVVYDGYNMVQFLASSTALVLPVCGKFCLKHIAHVSFGDVPSVDDTRLAWNIALICLCQRLLTPLLLNEDSVKQGAVAQCIAANKMADALVIAQVGGDSLWESTLDQYLKNNSSPYLKFYNYVSAGQHVVSTMVNNDIVILVNMRPQNSWKETLDLLCNVS
ncbi:transport protein Sec31 homolog B-like protein isoform X1 [Tanacetum coccineum]